MSVSENLAYFKSAWRARNTRLQVVPLPMSSQRIGGAPGASIILIGCVSNEFRPNCALRATDAALQSHDLDQAVRIFSNLSPRDIYQNYGAGKRIIETQTSTHSQS
jgi:hypothetical protein